MLASSRLHALRLFSFAAALAAIGSTSLSACSGGDDANGESPGTDDDGGSDILADGGTTPLADGATPEGDAGDPLGGYPTPIKHLIVIVKENHTFDNIFGEYTGGGLTAVTTAKLSDGTTITRPHCPAAGIPRDMPHDHTSAVNAYNAGKMTGLDKNKNTVEASGTTKKDYLGWCTFSDTNQVKFYWELAQNYTLADHFFTSMLAPSFPGHLSSAIGKSPAYGNPGCPAGEDSCESAVSTWGCTDAAGTTAPTWDIDTCTTKTSAFPCYDVPTWMDTIPSKYTWAVYGKGRKLTGKNPETNPQSLDANGAPLILSPFNAVKAHSSVAERKAHFHEERQIVPQIIYTNKASTALPDGGGLLPGLLPDLPNVMFWSDISSNSEHPPGTGGAPVSPECGEQDDYDIVSAVMSGQHWKDTAILITYDDWGGFYDHVAPTVEKCSNGLFYNTGFRVPAMIVSAYSKPGFVLHDVTEQASIPKLIEELFGAPMTSVRDPQNRDGKAGSLMGAFDFTQPPHDPVTL
ncbi:MAG TPA: alkaline phosphatase family protein, partial [Polyangiaceae bacterium]